MKHVAKRLAFTFAFVVAGIALGKLCQSAGVALLEPRLGFELASFAGLLPFLAALVLLKIRFPRQLSFTETRSFRS